VTYPITPDPEIHRLSRRVQRPAITPFAAQQLSKWATDLLNAIVSKVVHVLTFGIVPEGAVTNALTHLESWWGGFLNDVHDALTWHPNKPTITISTNRRISDVASAARGVRSDATKGRTELIPQHRIPSIPVSHLGADNPNLLVGGGFDNEENIDYASSYVWDGTVGNTGTGSVKVIGDGTTQTLFSNSIAVLSGDTFDVGGYVKWFGVTSTGTAIQLIAVAYSGSSTVSSTVIGSVSGLIAGSNSTGYSGANAGGWLNLSGTWNYDSGVPSTVDSIRLKLVVSNTVAAGTVWWDDLSAYKTGILTGSLVTGLDSGTTIVDDLQGTLDSAVDGFYNTTSAVAAKSTTLTGFKAIHRAQKVASDEALGAANSVKSGLTGGWTVDVITADGAVWTNPGSITLMWVVCFGGGAKGTDGGGTGSSGGGAGGVAGDYVAQQINPSLLPSTVTCTVGLGSTTSKTVTSFGSILSTTSETPGYIGSPLGYFASVSFPGNGGNGGGVSGAGNITSPGITGTAGYSAVGGFGGGATGNLLSANGTSGANAPTGGSAYSGGAGGGGGGGVYSAASKSTTVYGGNGGSGGFPGGGGGGGGGAKIATGTGNSAVGGTGANGGNGAIYLIYQKAYT